MRHGLKVLRDIQIMSWPQFLVLPVLPLDPPASGGGQQEDARCGRLPVAFPIVFIPLYVTGSNHGQTGFVHATRKPLNLTPMGQAAGRTSEAISEKMSTMQMIKVHSPTTDGRHIVMSRYTQTERGAALLFAQLRLSLPEQPPPRFMPQDR